MQEHPLEDPSSKFHSIPPTPTIFVHLVFLVVRYDMEWFLGGLTHLVQMQTQLGHTPF
jgi:hypothetical protein